MPHLKAQYKESADQYRVNIRFKKKNIAIILAMLQTIPLIVVVILWALSRGLVGFQNENLIAPLFAMLLALYVFASAAMIANLISPTVVSIDRSHKLSYRALFKTRTATIPPGSRVNVTPSSVVITPALKSFPFQKDGSTSLRLAPLHLRDFNYEKFSV